MSFAFEMMAGEALSALLRVPFQPRQVQERSVSTNIPSFDVEESSYYVEESSFSIIRMLIFDHVWIDSISFWSIHLFLVKYHRPEIDQKLMDWPEIDGLTISCGLFWSILVYFGLFWSIFRLTFCRFDAGLARSFTRTLHSSAATRTFSASLLEVYFGDLFWRQFEIGGQFS